MTTLPPHVSKVKEAPAAYSYESPNQSPPSSKLLMDEKPLLVLPQLAVTVGLNESLIIQQIHYWILKKVEDPDRYTESYRDGHWWVYNTAAEWRRQFPFWSEKTIRRIITGLREYGLLITETSIENKWDRTLWYRINYARLDAITPAYPPTE